MPLVPLLALSFFALLVLLSPFLLGVLVTISSRKEEERAAAWRGAASRIGFIEGSTHPGAELPTLRGTVDGHGVEVESILRNENDSHLRYTVVRSRFPESVPDGLSLTQASFATAFLPVLGKQDIPIADPRLDKQLMVQGRHPVAVQALLDIGMVRKALRRFFRTGVPGAKHSRVEGRDVIAERKGLLTDSKLDELVADTVGLVTAVTEGRVLAWKDIAMRQGLTFEQIGPAVRVSGVLNGDAVRIETWDGQKTGSPSRLWGLIPTSASLPVKADLWRETRSWGAGSASRASPPCFPRSSDQRSSMRCGET
jgi:hypothetical protein